MEASDTDRNKYDIVVVGGGPAGYIAAIRAAQLNAKTALIEKRAVGGTCLNRGCIPTKAYLKTAEMLEGIRGAAARGITIHDGVSFDMQKALAEKNRIVKRLTGGISALLSANGVDTYFGEARISPDKTVTVNGTAIAAEHVIFAGGSKAAKLDIPGMDSSRVLTSDDILDMDSVPERLAIIGGGVIGVEMASVFSAFGSKVTIIELMDHVLPMMDKDVSDTIRKTLSAKGIKVYTSAKLESIAEENGSVIVYTDKQEPVSVDYAMLSIGRVPDLSAVRGLDIALERGRVKVDDTMKSSIDWIYAPGDINGRCMLAHAAFKMGEIATENAFAKNAAAKRKTDLRYVPSCVYTMPEVGCVGLTEQQARESHDVSVGMFPFSANGRALASGEAKGFAKVITDKKHGEVLGVHIVGPCAAEIINEAAGLMAMEITAHEISDIIHGHPTFAEGFMEAAADSISRCMHLPPKRG